MSDLSIDAQRKEMYKCSLSKEGKVLLDYIEGECMRRMRGTDNEIQLAAGKFNLWLDICSEIAEGKGEQLWKVGKRAYRLRCKSQAL